MKKLSYTITTTLPIILSESVGGNNHISTAEFIPGASILGITAGKYIQKNEGDNAEQNTEFKRLFLSDSVLFRAATLSINGKRSLPVPLNIKEKKEETGSFVDSFENDEFVPTMKVSGFCGDNHLARPQKTVNFHTSRKENRLAGKSEDGEIFTYEGLSERQEFIGEILGDDKDLELIKSLFSDNKTIHIGRSKTAQYGEAKIVVSSCEDHTISKDENTFVLVSPAIILNEFGQSSTLLKDLEMNLDNVEIGKTMLSTLIVESYNRKWESKKPSELAFAPGSVMQLKGDVSTILKNGIGIRRNEGFGELAPVSINPELLKKNADSKKVNKPNGNVPNEVLELFSTVIKKECMTLAEHSAIKDKIKPKMPNSLTSRLLGVFQSNSVMNDIQSFISKAQTKKDDDSQVDKKASEHLKRVKLGQKSLFEILNNSTAEPSHFYRDNIKDKTTFLMEFPNKVGINPEEYSNEIWVHYWKLLLTSHMKEK